MTKTIAIWCIFLFVAAALSISAAPLSAQAATFATIHAFQSSEGHGPEAGVIKGSDGNLYGTTFSGGDGSHGTVFKMTPGGGGTWSLTTIYSFDVPGGTNPVAGVIMDGDGNLYGTTLQGGAYGYGTVFKLSSGGTLTTLHDFKGGRDGSDPYAGLIMDGSGNLYGTTEHGGGHNGNGTVFKLFFSNGSYNYRVIYRFSGTDEGADPLAGVIMDGSGNLYSTTYDGGAYGYGTVFKLTFIPKGKWGKYAHTTLYSFSSSPDGANPVGGVIMDGSGNLYGTTQTGGEYGYGTVFKLSSGGTLTTLYSFSSSDGANPLAGVIMDGSGNLYGTTQNGGASAEGTVFELSPPGISTDPWTLTTLHDFTDTGDDGAEPWGGVIIDSGTLYGTTIRGGSSGQYGTVFELTP